MEERLVQLEFSLAFNSGDHCSLLYKLRYIGVGEQFLFIISEFLSDRRQRVGLDGEVSVSVDVVGSATG